LSFALQQQPQYLVCMWKLIVCVGLTLWLCTAVSAQETEPFKPDAEFEFRLDYTFKERGPAEKSDYDADSERKPASSGPLPYLKTELKLLKLNTNEVRIKVLNHKGTTVVNRKISSNLIIKIDWGFSDDVKDHIVSNRYTVLLMNDDKKIHSRIVLNADADGSFFVNGQKRGRL
jgi:hypothetical protein